MKRKIIFTTPTLHYPTIGGPTLRIHNSILALSRIAEVHLISRAPIRNIGGVTGAEFYTSIVKKFMFSPVGEVQSSFILRLTRKCLKITHKIFNKFLNRICKVEFGLLENVRVNDADFIIDYAKQNAIDVIWCGYGNVSYDLMREINDKAPWLKIVCDTDSVWSRFILRELPYETDSERRQEILKEGTLKENEEKDWVRFCDVTTAVSEIDADYYRNLLNESDTDKIKVFSNVIDLDFYKQNLEKDERVKSPCIHLAGTFGINSPMDKAARWFIYDVFPHIREAMPNVTLNIVGVYSDVVLADIKEKNIKIFGRVDNIMRFLPFAEVTVVPLFFESGTRYKILEAAAADVPIVSTVLGAEGIELIHNEGIFTTDDPKEFADYTVRLFKDRELAELFTKKAYSLVKEKYSVESLINEAKVILDFLNKGD